MNVDVKPENAPAIELPSTAPQVRITAGVGSAAQKTWNLRRPLTLIGSRRPAHIVLHDRDISHAHCAIINSGRDVLLNDLHTSSGTLCNSERIGLTLLTDGDVITVGAYKIQVAIRIPEDPNEDSGCGLAFNDPTRFRTPVSISLLHTDQRWNLEEAAALIGRHPDAKILLDNKDVSRRHALVFRYQNAPAVFDLGGCGGVWVNGKQCSTTPLADADRITVGPFGLGVELNGSMTADAAAHEDSPEPKANVEPCNAPGDKTASYERSRVPGSETAHVQGDQNTDAAAVESELDELQKKIAESWDRLNAWQSQLLADADAPEKDPATREAEVNARDAAIRGQLHDITRFQEQLTERERQLAAERAQLQEEKDQFAADRKAFDEQETALAQRTDELARREHVLAQRWSRLYATTCPHCRKPVGPSANSRTS